MQKISRNQKVFPPQTACSPSCCIAFISSKVLSMCLCSLQSSWSEWRPVGDQPSTSSRCLWELLRTFKPDCIFITKSAFLEKKKVKTVFLQSILKTLLGREGWSISTLFGFISVRKQSYQQNWHIFVKLLNSGSWLECKRNDGGKADFALCCTSASSGDFMCK